MTVVSVQTAVPVVILVTIETVVKEYSAGVPFQKILIAVKSKGSRKGSDSIGGSNKSVSSYNICQLVCRSICWSVVHN